MFSRLREIRESRRLASQLATPQVEMATEASQESQQVCSQSYQQCVDSLVIKILKKEDYLTMDRVIKIISDENEVILYAEEKQVNRVEVGNKRNRIEELKAKIEARNLENEKDMAEIKAIEEEIARDEEVIKIADDIKNTAAEETPVNPEVEVVAPIAPVVSQQ